MNSRFHLRKTHFTEKLLHYHHFNEYDLFSMKNDAVTKINKWVSTDEYDFLDAEYCRYTEPEDPILHRRRIYFNKKKSFYCIEDVIKGYKSHNFSLYFHFSLLDLDSIDGEIIIAKAKNNNVLVVMPIRNNETSSDIFNEWTSESYGLKSSTPVLRLSQSNGSSAVFFNVLYVVKEKDNLQDSIKLGKSLKREYDLFVYDHEEK